MLVSEIQVEFVPCYPAMMHSPLWVWMKFGHWEAIIRRQPTVFWDLPNIVPSDRDWVEMGT